MGVGIAANSHLITSVSRHFLTDAFMSTSAIEARLPPELERTIFELAGWDDMPTMKTLVLVAHRVHLWIEPLLYRVQTSFQSNDFSATHKLVVARPQYARHVKYLLLWSTRGGLDRTQYEETLSACGNISYLVDWTQSASLLALSPHSLPNLTHLSIHVRPLVEDTSSTLSALTSALAILRNATHLDVSDLNLLDDPEDTIPRILQSAALPALTHLSFAEDPSNPEYFKEILSIPHRTNRLRQLVVFVENTDGKEEDHWLEKRIADPRFVVVYGPDFRKDWLRDKPWLWDRGDEAHDARGFNPDDSINYNTP
uniref:F-box domain-containing protein n=1 Tax=Mycena chlorophos TaxID=658473 RepID=A0ABQ0LI91_MYCCL|nr:predicted protein [Mycena chlorophos]